MAAWAILLGGWQRKTGCLKNQTDPLAREGVVVEKGRRDREVGRISCAWSLLAGNGQAERATNNIMDFRCQSWCAGKKQRGRGKRSDWTRTGSGSEQAGRQVGRRE